MSQILPRAALLTFAIASALGCAETRTSSSRPVRAVPAPDTQPKAFDEFVQKGVVIIALADPSDDSEMDDDKQVEARSSSDRPQENDSRKLLTIQLSIAEEVAASGSNFLLFVNSAATRKHVYAGCDKHKKVCESLRSGQARIEMLPYDGPWVRDYGPQFVYDSFSRIVVNDAGYHDIRWEQRLEDKIEEIDKQRLREVQRRQAVLYFKRFLRGGTLGPLEDESSDDSRDEDDSAAPVTPTPLERRMAKRSAVRDPKSALRAAEVATAATREEEQRRWAEERAWRAAERERAESEETIRLLQAERDALSVLKVGERVRDDRAAYHVAEAVLGDLGFALQHPPIDLDGGNILHLADGRCVTTGTLIGRNQRQQQTVEDTLTRYYGCRGVVFLRPLPGDVIEHVDMFLLRAGSRLALATYSPSEPKIGAHLARMNDATRSLVAEAATAMDENYARLHDDLKYDVVRVPSPLPVVVDDDVYYPTILNALVWMSQTNEQHVIMPKYRGYEEDVQADGLSKIEELFPSAKVVQVEATDAAKMQGAVHCLTLVAPYDQSRFEDQAKTGAYVNTAREMAKIQNDEIARSLEGSWRGVREHSTKVVVDNRAIRVFAGGRVQDVWAIQEIDSSGGRGEVHIVVHDDAAKKDAATMTLSVDLEDPDRITIDIPSHGEVKEKKVVVKRIDE